MYAYNKKSVIYIYSTASALTFQPLPTLMSGWGLCALAQLHMIIMQPHSLLPSPPLPPYPGRRVGNTPLRAPRYAKFSSCDQEIFFLFANAFK